MKGHDLMSYAKRLFMGRGQASVVGGMLAALLTVSVAFSVSDAQAQGKQPAGAKTNPKKGKPAKPRSTWVKICSVPKKGQTKGCITRSDIVEHEVMQVYGILGIETIEGKKEKKLIATLPYSVIVPRKVKDPKTKKDVTIPASLPLAWNIGSSVKVKIDKGNAFEMNFYYCHRVGCVAWVNITDQFVAKLKKGKGMVIMGPIYSGLDSKPREFPLPISLSGFGAAYDGVPVDNKKYELFWNREIGLRRLAQHNRQNKFLKKIQEQQKAAKAKAGKNKKKPK